MEKNIPKVECFVIYKHVKIEKKCLYDSDEEYVIEGINVAKNAVLNSGLVPSQATKNNTIFTAIQSEIEMY